MIKIATVNVGLKYQEEWANKTSSAIHNKLEQLEKNPIKIKIDMNGIQNITPQTIQSIKDLQKALKNLGSVNTNTDISKLINSLARLSKLDINHGKLDQHINSIVKGLNKLNAVNVNQDVVRLIGNLSTLNRELNRINDTNNNSNGGQLRSINNKMLMAGAAFALGSLKEHLQDSYEFEKSLAQVGIAGEKTTAQVRDLRVEYYNLSVETGKSAKEIVSAGQAIIKTGQSFESAQLILKEAVKLSIATGEPLEKTSESLSKILLTLRINANEVTQVTNKMMSVVNKTPASMFSLQEALKQANAGFANFIDTTHKTGTELDKYKQKLLDVELAGSGGMALLGRRGEQTGTALRSLTNNLLSMEKTAKSLFNADMKLNDVWVTQDKITNKLTTTTKGQAGAYKLNSDMLVKLSQEDLPSAIELMSKLWIKGDLTSQTMQKIFTRQHAPYLQNYLTQVNGDIDAFNKSLTEGGTVTEAYSQAQESWANQWDLFTASVVAGNKAFSGFLDRIGTGYLKGLTDFNTTIGEAYDKSSFLKTIFDALPATILTAIASIKLFGAIARNEAISAENAFKKFGLSIGVGLTLGMMANQAIASYGAQLLQDAESKADAALDRAKRYNELVQSIIGSKKQLEANESEFKILASANISKDWEHTNVLLEDAFDNFTKLKIATSNIQDFVMGIQRTVNNTDFKGMRESLSEYKDPSVTNESVLREKIKKLSKTSSMEIISESDFKNKKQMELELSFYEKKKKLFEEYINMNKVVKMSEGDFLNQSKALIINAKEGTKAYEEQLKAYNAFTLAGIESRSKLMEIIADENTAELNRLSDLIQNLKTAGQELDRFKQQTKEAIVNASSFEDLKQFTDEMSKLYGVKFQTGASGDLLDIQMKNAKKDIEYQTITNHLMEEKNNLVNAQLQAQAQLSSILPRKNELFLKGGNRTQDEQNELMLLAEKSGAYESIIRNSKTDIKLLEENIKYQKIKFEMINSQLTLVQNVEDSSIYEMQNLKKINNTKLNQLYIDKEILDIQYKTKKESIEANIAFQEANAERQNFGDTSEASLKRRIALAYDLQKSERVDASGRRFKGLTENEQLELKIAKELLSTKTELKTLNIKYENDSVISLTSQLKYISDVTQKYTEQSKLGFSDLNIKKANLIQLKGQLNLEDDMLEIANLNYEISKASIDITKAEIDKENELIKIASEKIKLKDKMALLTANEGEQILLNSKVEKDRIQDEEDRLNKQIADRKKARESALDDANTQKFQIQSKLQASDYTQLGLSDYSKLSNDEKKAYDAKVKNTLVLINQLRVVQNIIDSEEDEIANNKDLLDLGKLSVDKKKEYFDTLRATLGLEKNRLEREYEFNDLKYTELSLYRDLTHEQKIQQLESKKATNEKVASRDVYLEYKKELENGNEKEANALWKIQDKLRNGIALNSEELSILQSKGNLQKHAIILKKDEIDKTKENLDYLKQQVSYTLEYVDALSKGESIKFNASEAITGASQGLTNIINASMGGKAEGSKDWASVAFATAGVITNMQNQVLTKESENIKNRLEIYDMQKQLATSEEERQRIDQQILDAKKQQIDLEMQKQTQFMGVSGAGGGALGGLAQGVMGGMAGGAGGMIAGGLLGLLSGFMGGQQAEENARIQKQQLEEQERTRKLIEVQNKNSEFVKQWVVKAGATGINKGLESSLYSKGISIGSSGNISGGTFKTIKSLEDKSTEYRDKMFALNNTPKSTGKTTLSQKLSESIKQQTLSDYATVILQIDTKLKELNENKKVLSTAYFDFEVAQVENTTELYIKDWTKRADLMNQFVENAKNGLTNVSDYIGEYIGDSFTNAWVRNDDAMNDSLDNFEEKVKAFSSKVQDKEVMQSLFGKNINKNMIDVYARHMDSLNKLTNSGGSEKDKQADIQIMNQIKYASNLSDSQLEALSYMRQMVNESDNMNNRQKELNKDTSNFSKLWVSMGGSLSSMISMLPEFSKNLYESMRGSLLETNFVDRFNKIGETLSSTISDKLTKSIFDKKFSNKFIELNDTITNIMSSENVTTDMMMGARNQLQQYSASVEAESLRLRGQLDMLKMSNNIEYSSVNQPIEYSSGSTVTQVFNVSNNVTISGVLIGNKEGYTALSNEMVSYLDTAFRNQGKVIGG